MTDQPRPVRSATPLEVVHAVLHPACWKYATCSDQGRRSQAVVDALTAAGHLHALVVGPFDEQTETALMRAALDEHYAAHPHARPSAAQVAQALAEQQATGHVPGSDGDGE